MHGMLHVARCNSMLTNVQPVVVRFTGESSCNDCKALAGFVKDDELVDQVCTRGGTSTMHVLTCSLLGMTTLISYT